MNFDLTTAQLMLYRVGRALLGLYFLVPGIMKITGFAGTAQFMANDGVPLAPFLLVVTIILQVGGGICLIIGYRAHLVAFVLAGLTLLINLFIHDFWADEPGLVQGHEQQNFIKNLAIMAGLLVVAGLKPPGRDASPG